MKGYRFKEIEGSFAHDGKTIDISKKIDFSVHNQSGLNINKAEHKEGLYHNRNITIENFNFGMLWKVQAEAFENEGFWYKAEAPTLGTYEFRESHTYHYSNVWTFPIQSIEWSAKYCSDGIFYSLIFLTGVGKRRQSGEATKSETETLQPIKVTCKLALPTDVLINEHKKLELPENHMSWKMLERLTEKLETLDVTLNKSKHSDAVNGAGV